MFGSTVSFGSSTNHVVTAAVPIPPFCEGCTRGIAPSRFFRVNGRGTWKLLHRVKWPAVNAALAVSRQGQALSRNGGGFFLFYFQ